MADIVYVAIVLAFFTLCVLYVNWCDRIVGNDDLPSGRPQESQPTAERSPSAGQPADDVEQVTA